MTDIINIAASGLDAASKRVQAAAKNTANAFTESYQPVDAVTKADGKGGVVTTFAPRLVSNSLGGLDNGVDLAREAVDMNMAVTAYKANAAVIKNASEMERELIRDINV